MKNFLIVFVLGCALVFVGCQEDLSDEVKALSDTQTTHQPNTHKAPPPPPMDCAGDFMVTGIPSGTDLYVRIWNGNGPSYHLDLTNGMYTHSLPPGTYNYSLEYWGTNLNVRLYWCFCDTDGSDVLSYWGDGGSFTIADPSVNPNCPF